MAKRRRFRSISDVAEVSDEEYQRLAAQASARMRAEARRHLPRSERLKSPIENTVVSDEEYAALAESARSQLRRTLKPSRRERAELNAAKAIPSDVTEEEYRKLSGEMIMRSERAGERQERIIGFLQRMANPITFAVLLFAGICVYFLLQNQHMSIF